MHESEADAADVSACCRAAAAWRPVTARIARGGVALLLAALLAVSGAGAEGGGAGGSGDPPRLTIERLYSLPHLIGTAPRGFAWSADGRRLAFLWNEEGFELRDVWLLDVEEPGLEPRRVTWMPRPEAAVEAGADAVEVAAARERVERDPGVTGVAWYPDGRRLLATLRGDLWEVEPGSAPRRLTRSAAAEMAASWSTDGGTLAYLREGDLWTVEAGAVAAAGAAAAVGEAAVDPRAGEGDGLHAAEVRRTRTADADVRIADYRWSPDGSRIAVLEIDERPMPLRSIPDYLTEEPVLDRVRRAYPGEETAHRRVGIVELGAAGPEAGPVTWIELADPAPALLLDYRWSPDGRRLAVDTSDLYAKDRRIFVVELENGAPVRTRLVARDRDPRNETYYFWRIAWSVDGRSLYFLSDREDDYHVWAVEVGEAGAGPAPPRRLTGGGAGDPWAVAEMHPVAGGLVVVANRGNPEERQLYRVAGDGGEPRRLSRRPGTHDPTPSPDGRWAAVAFSSDTTPPDLFLTALDPELRRELGAEATERRITTSPLPEFERYRWAVPSYVEFPSHVDGSTLHGRLTLPPDLDPERAYPAILGSVYTDTVRNQWGGRTAHPTWGLDQYLAQEGYVLLNVDVRGSWGRGREHRRGIRLDYGGIDVEDLASGVRFLGTLGRVDMERVGIWGSSYGGLMTCMSLFRKPHLYAAGVAGAPATNVWHALPGQMAVMMRPEDRPAEYADSSPFLHAEGLEDPLMIVHGMRDRVVLFKDSVTLVQRLIRLGKSVELVALPDAGHGWDAEGLAQTRFAFRKLVGFFDRHLKEGCE